MDLGKCTTWSNAYNQSPKGVYWHDFEQPDTRFFTSILNGKTYRDIGENVILTQDFGQEVEGPDVSDVMPDGWDADAPIIS